MTISFAVIATAVVLYFQLQTKPLHPREADFVNCYAELALLAARSDTISSSFLHERDSILLSLAFTDSSLRQVKSELNRDPQRLIEIWDLIENRLKERRLELGLGPEPVKE